MARCSQKTGTGLHTAVSPPPPVVLKGMAHYRQPSDFSCLKAPNCFSHLPRGAEEAALSCWKTFLHPDGDHFTLINLYKAYQDMTLNAASERK